MTRKPRMATKDDQARRFAAEARYEYEQALIEELLAAFKAIRPLLRRMAIEGAVSQELVDQALGYMAAIERAVLQGD